MGEIEKALHQLHAAAREGKSEDTVSAQQSADPQPPRGFARVTSVAEGSPAASAVSHLLIQCS